MEILWITLLNIYNPNLGVDVIIYTFVITKKRNKMEHITKLYEVIKAKLDIDYLGLDVDTEFYWLDIKGFLECQGLTFLTDSEGLFINGEVIVKEHGIMGDYMCDSTIKEAFEEMILSPHQFGKQFKESHLEKFLHLFTIENLNQQLWIETISERPNLWDELPEYLKELYQASKSYQE